MRFVCLMLTLAVAALGCATGGDASAQGRYSPWCAFYDAWTYNCGFMSMQQCLATRSGVGGACRPNPYGPPAADARGRPPQGRRPGF